MTKNEMTNWINHWVYENYGESELENPSWDIEELAEHLVDMINSMKENLKAKGKVK